MFQKSRVKMHVCKYGEIFSKVFMSAECSWQVTYVQKYCTFIARMVVNVMTATIIYNYYEILNGDGE